MKETPLPCRTKILATLGPATDDPAILVRILQAGADVVRLNFSHGSIDEQKKRIASVRECEQIIGRSVGVLGDLQGPKIRIGSFRHHRIFLEDDAEFTLDAEFPIDRGTKERVGLSYKSLPADVVPGDTLLLDDGLITLTVLEVVGSKVRCRVLAGGILSDRKGINRLGGGLSAPALTEKDLADIRHAAQLNVDYLAVSFPRCAEDIHTARKLFCEAGGQGHIIAKIERAEALDAIEEIIEASDAIMIARGDLGVEIGDAALPPVQKRLITLARERNRVVITATQMMQSMIENPIPTRAEVFDVANAVLQGTDAVMLSAETAAGKFPDRAVAAMNRICRETERQAAIDHAAQMETSFARVDEAIAKAAIYIANHLGVEAIAALTESGSTALWMSRMNATIPIFALTPHPHTERRVTLYRGVEAMPFSSTATDQTQLNRDAVAELLRRGVVKHGDLVIITKGDITGERGGTNGLKICRVGELA